MRSRSSPGAIFIRYREKQRRAARFWLVRRLEYLCFQLLLETTDPPSEQKNRERNREITGAYQGDNREDNSAGQPPRKSYIIR